MTLNSEHMQFSGCQGTNREWRLRFISRANALRSAPHPQLWALSSEAMDPRLVEALRGGSQEHLVELAELFSFGAARVPFFTPQTCRALLDNLEALEKHPASLHPFPAPLSNYGVTLSGVAGVTDMFNSCCSFGLPPWPPRCFLARVLCTVTTLSSSS
jgi:hypothetical protein